MKLRGATLMAGLLTLALAGCGTHLQTAQETKATGDAFSSSLHYYYTQRAAQESAEGHYSASDYFAGKAVEAAGGTAVLPTEMSARDVPPETFGELAQARRELLEALDGGGRSALPDTAAKTQVIWECWFEEQEENIQPEDIAACKESFWANLNAVQLAIAPVPEPEPEPAPPAPQPEPEPARFLVYFDFDDSSIRADQVSVMEVIIAAAQAAPDRAIHIVGHADTSGAVDYNQALSERRTNTVIGDLLGAGISRGRISSEAAGENKSLVATGDGVKEQGNRVAQVTLF